jgi:hypothetical protein
LRSQSAQLVDGPLEQLGGVPHLPFHSAQLLANAVRGIMQHHVQIEEAGFHIAERLAEIVNQTGEDLFVSCGAVHVKLRGRHQYNART